LTLPHGALKWISDCARSPLRRSDQFTLNVVQAVKVSGIERSAVRDVRLFFSFERDFPRSLRCIPALREFGLLPAENDLVHNATSAAREEAL
jgi:hypothetical protein